ncbi:hypothetical protein H4J02_04265 [Protaetiibacter sp. SSC-01]|uniref:SHOCT domain-containing protein n=1 Tax=Protaetiibacter sp. SSC-01 TaxID=2759943 RepID=UPI0016576299|nr:SHOCT domain-containing protein [Protaetiibacter sp. SSC-01]QNO38248.1 hypothetical protein H4J02_04265 [Protaetiibacter sp. SSC-01]
MDPEFPVPEAGFPALFGIVTAIIIIGAIVVVVMALLNARKAVELGHNPLTMQTELQAKILDSQALAPERTVEDRLEELERLRAGGSVDDAEYEAARARILGSI